MIKVNMNKIKKKSHSETVLFNIQWNTAAHRLPPRVKGQPRVIKVNKLSSTQLTDTVFQRFFKFFLHTGVRPWSIWTNSFPHPTEAPHEIWLQSAQWFQRCLKSVDDDDDGQRPANTINSPMSLWDSNA